MNLTNPSVLRALLEPHGFRFSKSMGQNFLIAQWVPERIAEEADELTRREQELEGKLAELNGEAVSLAVEKREDIRKL